MSAPPQLADTNVHPTRTTRRNACPPELQTGMSALLAVFDAEPLEFPRGRRDLGFDSADEIGHPAAHVLHDVVHFAFVTFQNKLDSAVRQVLHVTIHVVLHRDVLRRVPKADPLDMAAEMISSPLHRSSSKDAISDFGGILAAA